MLSLVTEAAALICLFQAQKEQKETILIRDQSV